MTSTRFVHLHLHSEYSLLDGSIKVKKLVKELKEQGYTACALTDHDAMHGAMEFYLTAKNAGIHPILGYEANIETFLPEKKNATEKTAHLILLAENNVGYSNLTKIVTLANTSGTNRHGNLSTSITWAELQQHSQGLICLTSCMKGELAKHLLSGKEQNAQKFLDHLIAIFSPERLFVEIMDNGLPTQKKLIPQLVSLAEKNNIPIVATNDVHYLSKKDRDTHLSLLAIKHKLQKSDVRNMPDDVFFHLASADEMCQRFASYPMALENTLRIAERCQVHIDTKSIFMPDYTEQEGESSDDCLVRLSRDGLATRKTAVQKWMGADFCDEKWKEYEDRLQYELQVILKMKFAGYFLIVQDFINWAKNQNIPVGPGRGSAAGSLVTYALRITNIDPIRFHLLFERFLNPERISMPDIDTDFCQEGRGAVLNYVYQKYGQGAVAQIVTFGRMMAKNALKNLARISGWSFFDSNEFAKLIPESPGITLEQALQDEPRIQERLDSEERAQQLWDGALEIEGTLNSLGIHAAGVIISDGNISERCPLLETEGQMLTQYEHKYAEKIGLIKFDFLGLKTLTVVAHAIKLIAENHNTKLDVDDFPLEDATVYRNVCTGHTTGMFQLESTGMRKLIRELQPSCFTDIVAVLALFRPGPLGSGMVEDFVKRKHGENEVSYVFDELEPILQDTYGIIVYQEQVQKIAAVLANYSLGEADLLRRAMGKKDKNEMERQKSRFIQGATENKHDAAESAKLFDLMAMFAEYGFNKSHSAAYGWITYQTAWLKTYYPTEFMTAIMTCDLDNLDKISIYVRDCRRMGIDILPPLVNESSFTFTVPAPQKIRYGLGAIKGLGQGVIELICKERNKNGKFATVPEFLARVDARKVNKKVMESLVFAGCFDDIATNRREVMENSETWIKVISKELDSREEMASSLFGFFEETSPKETTTQNIEKNSHKTSLKNTKILHGHKYFPGEKETLLIPEKITPELRSLLHCVQLNKCPPWDIHTQLKHEWNCLGFYLDLHPSLPFQRDYEEIGIAQLSHLAAHIDPSPIPEFKKKAVTICGQVTQLIEKKNKEGQPYLAFRIEDGSGALELTLFSRQYQALAEPIVSGAHYCIACKLQKGIEEGSVRGTVQEIEKLENKRKELVKQIVLKADDTFLNNQQTLPQLEKILSAAKGPTPFVIHVDFPEQRIKFKALMGSYFVDPTDELILNLNHAWPGQVFVDRIYSY